jgi:hypothetical protein
MSAAPVAPTVQHHRLPAAPKTANPRFALVVAMLGFWYRQRRPEHLPPARRLVGRRGVRRDPRAAGFMPGLRISLLGAAVAVLAIAAAGMLVRHHTH